MKTHCVSHFKSFSLGFRCGIGSKPLVLGFFFIPAPPLTSPPSPHPTSSPSPLSMNGEGERCFSSDGTEGLKSRRKHKSPQKTQEGFTSTMLQASPPHEMRKSNAAVPRCSFAFRGGVGGLRPPTQKNYSTRSGSSASSAMSPKCIQV